jgi:hypothetical protein
MVGFYRNLHGRWTLATVERAAFGANLLSFPFLSTGLFWVVLGAVGGLFYARSGYVETQKYAQ